ncbi:MAG: prepilin-type N-terminal cleavage/methylation domain-containing protein [Clostridiaceae bacterium]|nr:prepilin-type N-terminal cleavage/methylation domain-containing protein [Clostridiaceae bacterium]
MLKMLKNNEKGFSLVELMVVVVIIGVLVAIAIPVYNITTDRAERGACHANQRMIEGAASQYAMNTGKSINDVNDLNEYFKNGTPTCPSGGTYTYDIEDGKVSCDAPGHYHYSESEEESEEDLSSGGGGG